MAQKIGTFTVEDGKIHITGIENLCRLCNYVPTDRNQMYSGIELADELKDDKGAALFVAGTQLRHPHITKLDKNIGECV